MRRAIAISCVCLALALSGCAMFKTMTGGTTTTESLQHEQTLLAYYNTFAIGIHAGLTTAQAIFPGNAYLVTANNLLTSLDTVLANYGDAIARGIANGGVMTVTDAGQNFASQVGVIIQQINAVMGQIKK